MENRNFNHVDYPLQTETDTIIKLGIEVHKNLGPGFLEIAYKEAFEHELKTNTIFYEREREYSIYYKNIILSNSFYADFVVFDQVILEIKAKENGIGDADMAQTINYLKCSNFKVGLILNFAKMKLEIKRVVF